MTKILAEQTTAIPCQVILRQWGWDQVLVDGISNAFGMPSGILDFEFDMAEVEEGSDTTKL